jgi:hypothetical protein
MALISPAVVEREYGITTAQLRCWRLAGIGPEYFRLGPRSIGYYTADLEDWLEDPANAHLHNVPSHELTFRCDQKVLTGS